MVLQRLSIANWENAQRLLMRFVYAERVLDGLLQILVASKPDLWQVWWRGCQLTVLLQVLAGHIQQFKEQLFFPTTSSDTTWSDSSSLSANASV